MDIKRALDSLKEWMNEMEEMDKYIISIFNDYGYSTDNINIIIIRSYHITYGAEIYTTCETTINNINLYQFIEEHFGNDLEIRSKSRKSSINLNLIQCMQIQKHILKEIDLGINEVLGHVLKDKMDELERLKPSLQDWKNLLEKILKYATEPTTKEHKFDDTVLVSNLLKIIDPLLQKEKNQKGSNNITNKEAALIYDLLYYIKYGSKNMIASNKEKSDYIRYRLKKKVGNPIVEK